MKSVNMDNYKLAVPKDWRDLMESLGYLNNETKVMREVLNEYKDSKIPAYIIFITDGGVDASEEIEKFIIEASKYPIFWQFVGIGGDEIFQNVPTDEELTDDGLMQELHMDKDEFLQKLHEAMDRYKSVPPLPPYGILEKLDNISGRYVDNVDFFALDDFKQVSNEELYDRLLNELPSWLKEIKQKGMI